MTAIVDKVSGVEIDLEFQLDIRENITQWCSVRALGGDTSLFIPDPREYSSDDVVTKMQVSHSWRCRITRSDGIDSDYNEAPRYYVELIEPIHVESLLGNVMARFIKILRKKTA